VGAEPPLWGGAPKSKPRVGAEPPLWGGAPKSDRGEVLTKTTVVLGGVTRV
jgi:hypothetical protein